jgi:hypothetical protein
MFMDQDSNLFHRYRERIEDLAPELFQAKEMRLL